MMRNYYAEALAEIPGIAEVDAAIAVVEERLKRPVTTTRTPDLTAITDEIINGGDIPDDIGESTVRAVAEQQEANSQVAAVKQIHESLKRRRQSIIDTNASREIGLSFLAGHLSAVLARSAEVIKRLGRVRDDHAALNASPTQTQAWMDLRTVAREYGALWSAHWSFCKGKIEPDVYRSVAYLREQDRIWVPKHSPNIKVPVVGPPWPHSNPLNGDPAIGRDYMIWLSDNPDVEPWLPTLAEIRAEIAAQAERARGPVNHVLVSARGDNAKSYTQRVMEELA